MGPQNLLNLNLEPTDYFFFYYWGREFIAQKESIIFSSNRPTGPIRYSSRNVRVSVCVSVCLFDVPFHVVYFKAYFVQKF